MEYGRSRVRLRDIFILALAIIYIVTILLIVYFDSYIFQGNI